MSIHKSLKSKGKLTRHRNVLTRTEQLEALKGEERWEEGNSIFGLPKVRVYRMKHRSKAAKKEEEAPEGAAEEGAPVPGAGPTETEGSS